MGQDVEKLARRTAAGMLTEAGRPGDVRVEVTANDRWLVVYRRPLADRQPYEWICKNACYGRKPFAGPVVIDPATGLMSYRYVIPLPLYSHYGVEETLQMVLSGNRWNGGLVADWSKLLQSKGLPAGGDDVSFGRSGRLGLITDRWPALLTVRLFPGELADKNLVRSPECISRVAGVLLARSGAPRRPQSFHMIRGTGFFSVERAIEIYYLLSAQRLKSMEKDLLEQAEEDRRVISALMNPEVPISQLLGI